MPLPRCLVEFCSVLVCAALEASNRAGTKWVRFWLGLIAIGCFCGGIVSSFVGRPLLSRDVEFCGGSGAIWEKENL